MKYNEILNEVKNVYPSEYEDTQLIKWLEEAENNICIYIESEPVKIKDLSEESIALSPFDRLYIDFICAHISLHQHDNEAYARYIEMYNARYKEFCKWYIRTHEGKNYRFKNWI